MNGSNLMIVSRKALAQINTTLNALGMDTITTGNIAAFLMELTERGLLRDYRISWGDLESYMRLIHDIAYRRGIGNLLAEGLARASKELNAEEYAVHIKRLEIPAYDPRGLSAWH